MCGGTASGDTQRFSPFARVPQGLPAGVDEAGLRAGNARVAAVGPHHGPGEPQGTGMPGNQELLDPVAIASASRSDSSTLPAGPAGLM